MPSPLSYNDPKPVGQADSRDKCSGFTGQGLWRQKEVKKSQGVRQEFTLTLGYTTLVRPSSRVFLEVSAGYPPRRCTWGADDEPQLQARCDCPDIAKCHKA